MFEPLRRQPTIPRRLARIDRLCGNSSQQNFRRRRPYCGPCSTSPPTYSCTAGRIATAGGDRSSADSPNELRSGDPPPGGMSARSSLPAARVDEPGPSYARDEPRRIQLRRCDPARSRDLRWPARHLGHSASHRLTQMMRPIRIGSGTLAAMAFGQAPGVRNRCRLPSRH